MRSYVFPGTTVSDSGAELVSLHVCASFCANFLQPFCTSGLSGECTSSWRVPTVVAGVGLITSSARYRSGPVLWRPPAKSQTPGAVRALKGLELLGLLRGGWLWSFPGYGLNFPKSWGSIFSRYSLSLSASSEGLGEGSSVSTPLWSSSWSLVKIGARIRSARAMLSEGLAST